MLPQPITYDGMILVDHRRKEWLTCTVALAIVGLAVGKPSFPAVDAEPLSTVPAGAMVLHEGWQMRDANPAGEDGAAVSQPGFSTSRLVQNYGSHDRAGHAGAARALSRSLTSAPIICLFRMPATTITAASTWAVSAIFPTSPIPGPGPIGSAKSFVCRQTTGAKWSGCIWTGSTIGPMSG